MAVIKLDISEYELMKDKARLLEAALDREKDLNDKITALQKEKVEVLENNKMVVTIVETIETVETKSTARTPRQIVEALTGLYDRFGNYVGMRSSFDPQEELHKLFEVLFETHTNRIHGQDSDKTVTTKGFDEVRAEMYKEYEDSMDEKAKDTRKRAETAIDKYEVINELLNKERTLLSLCSESNIKLKRKYTTLKNKFDAISSTQDKLKVLNEKLQEGISRNIDLSCYNSYKKNLIKILANERV